MLECDIGLLVGYDCPRALAPREVIPGFDDGPYAVRTDLGWSIVGVLEAEVFQDEYDVTYNHR